ncbi:O-antigen ligase family protein [Arcticibacter sp. MXS-1]|uniref:O-antigen ligase family protein n=1 Tax=Arcticibacter sp. MXS-1 TaxID=3341726 RepID=UPI0035A996C6
MITDELPFSIDARPIAQPGKTRLSKATLVMLGGCVVIVTLLKVFGILGGALFLLLGAGIPVVAAMIAFPQFGILTLLFAAYLIMWFIRMNLISFPLGTLMDAMEVLLLVGFLIKQKQQPDWKIYKNPITYLVVIWIIYNLIQVANPSAESRLAWLYTIRSVAMVMLMYFVFLYHITSVEFIRVIIKVWLALSLFAAAYALKQEFIGFAGFELNELAASPKLQELLFIGGHWRKFSIFSDPVAFSYNMVASTLLCIALIWGPTSAAKKIVLTVISCVLIFAMLFSGTRGAYVLIPAACCLWFILCYNRKILVIMLIAAGVLGTLIMMPTDNPGLMRFQSAFRPSEDASYSVRANNQKRIKPYIHRHPLGGGLGATGVWGARFAPYSFLASFPPDSGYVRVAVELGWLGLIIFSTFMFVVLKTGIQNFFRIRDPELKSYCLAMVLIIFALNVGNFPQEALVQFPTSIYFYMYIAIMMNTLRIDQQKWN